MRLLHTSDWHLGRRLYDRPRQDEHRQFLAWLLEIIKKEKIDVLLLAGDVFDSTVPAASVVDMYYQFLFQFYQQTGAHAVIISGNHDSALRLAAPRDFLKIARIHLVGHMPDEGNRENDGGNPFLISIRKESEKIAVVALPYIPEGEILSHVSFEDEIESSRRYCQAIKKLYEEAVSQIPAGVPAVLMGHFFLAGGQVGESERPIQVGGSQPVGLQDLPESIHYAALGHIHRPQRFQHGNALVTYSGSPIPMTFKEAEYDKKLFILDIKSGKPVALQEIVIPVFRPLVRVKGDFQQILQAAEDGEWEGKFVEVQLELDTPEVGLSDQIRAAFAQRGGEVASVQATLVNQAEENILTQEELESHSPDAIFERFYVDQFGEPEDDETKNRLEHYLSTFKDLLKLHEQKQQTILEP